MCLDELRKAIFNVLARKLEIHLSERHGTKDMLKTTSTEFKQMTARGVALVDFDVPWCAFSRIQERILDSLAHRFSESASVVAVDVNEIQPIAVELNIHHVPTLVLFKEGREVRRFIGLQSEETLGAAIENVLR